MTSGRSWNDSDFAGFVQPLQDGVDGGEVVRVGGKVDADVIEPIANFDRGPWDAAAEHEPAGIRQAQRHGGREAEQSRQRSDGLGEVSETAVDLLPLCAER